MTLDSPRISYGARGRRVSMSDGTGLPPEAEAQIDERGRSWTGTSGGDFC